MPFPQQPIYSATIALGHVSKEDMHAMAMLVLRALKWQVTGADSSNIHAFTGTGGEIFDIKILHGHLTYSSKSIDPIVDSAARNRANLEAFKHAMENHLAYLQQYGRVRKIASSNHELEGEINEELNRPGESALWKLLVPREGFYVTPIITYICIIVYLIMGVMGAGFIDPSSQSLIKWGANYSPLTLGGQWWRLITCVFIHVGIFHLVLNLFGLIFVAIFVEPILGAWRFLAAYLVMGVLASLCSVWWHTFILSAGASGAIMGMYGLFMALLASDLIDKNFRRGGLIYFGIIVAFNLLSGLKEGIDNAAHVGGLVSGFIIGYMYYPSLKVPERVWLKYFSPAVVLLLGAGITVYAINNIPNYIAIYDSKMVQFDQNRDQALKIFEMKDSLPKTQMLLQIDHQGIQLWQQNIRLMNDLDQIPRLPKELKTEIKELKAYSTLREHDYKLQYKRVEKETNSYDDSLVMLEYKIDSVLTIIHVADSMARKGG